MGESWKDRDETHRSMRQRTERSQAKSTEDWNDRDRSRSSQHASMARENGERSARYYYDDEPVSHGDEGGGDYTPSRRSQRAGPYGTEGKALGSSRRADEMSHATARAYRSHEKDKRHFDDRTSRESERYESQPDNNRRFDRERDAPFFNEQRRRERAEESELSRYENLERRSRRSPQSNYGKGPKGYQKSDERLREQVCDALAEDEELDASAMSVTVAEGEVTLTGTVDSRASKYLAETLAAGILGIKGVTNQLRPAANVASNPLKAAEVPSGHEGKHTDGGESAQAESTKAKDKGSSARN